MLLSSKISLNDYPFGMVMTGRSESNGEYRYGFQGQERDDEVKGSGNSVNYKYRMHDPRIGRFFAVDPLTRDYPHYTPYSFSGNKVIHAIELEGLEELEINDPESGATSINPAYKQRAILTLPDASTVMIYNAVQGGRVVMSRSDFEKVQGFSEQGFIATSGIAYKSSGLGVGNTTGIITAGIDGTPNPNNITAPQHMTADITFPSQITPQFPVQQQFLGGAIMPNSAGNVTPVEQQSVTRSGGHGTFTAQNANKVINDLINAAPLGATVDNFIVNVGVNQNMSAEQLEAFKASFMADINPTATVNFVSFDPNDHSNPTLAAGASSASQFNQVTATQTNAPVQTLQIIATP